MERAKNITFHEYQRITKTVFDMGFRTGVDNCLYATHAAQQLRTDWSAKIMKIKGCTGATSELRKTLKGTGISESIQDDNIPICVFVDMLGQVACNKSCAS